MLNVRLWQIQDRKFCFLLLLNLISNLAASYVYRGVVPELLMVFLSFSSAWIEWLIVRLWRKRWMSVAFMAFFVALHEFLIMADYFLMFEFQKIINQDVIDIVAVTNWGESCGFFATYLRPHIIGVWIAVMVALNYLLWWLAKLIAKCRMKEFAAVCVMAGIGVWLFMLWSFAFYRKGEDIPQYHAVTRTANAFYVLKLNLCGIKMLRDVASQTKACCQDDNPPDVIVVLGESHSVYHTSLYGYDRPTSPMLAKRVERGELAVFDNAVSVADFTNRAMLSVFSLDSASFGLHAVPMFPMCFKSAGYHTALYDNQYFVGNGVNFLTDADLSKLMFDVRNTQKYAYDMQMVSDMKKMSSPCLYVIHLNGQHYDYRERFPASFVRFVPKDYSGPLLDTEEKRQVVANYDNATCYVDAVVDSVIQLMADRDCLVIYLSDHGEEVYDYRDFVGHGNASMASDIRYQLRVPLMIWMSPTYVERRPEVAERVFRSVHLPVSTNDVSHLILDMAGISNSFFLPERSVIHPKYEKYRHRIVLNSVDFDQ